MVNISRCTTALIPLKRTTSCRYLRSAWQHAHALSCEGRNAGFYHLFMCEETSGPDRLVAASRGTSAKITFFITDWIHFLIIDLLLLAAVLLQWSSHWSAHLLLGSAEVIPWRSIHWYAHDCVKLMTCVTFLTTPILCSKPWSSINLLIVARPPWQVLVWETISRPCKLVAASKGASVTTCWLICALSCAFLSPDCFHTWNSVLSIECLRITFCFEKVHNACKTWLPFF